MQTVSETFAGTITVNRQMRLALPRMAMSLLIMSYLVADGVLISRFVGTTALSALSMSYPLTALLIAAGFMILKTVESTLSQIRRRRARGTSGLWPSSP